MGFRGSHVSASLVTLVALMSLAGCVAEQPVPVPPLPATLLPAYGLGDSYHFDDGSVDILVIDDSDSGKEIAADLSSWTRKLSPAAIVLLHGLQLERDDSPATAWNAWVGKRSHAKFPEGLGLGVAIVGESEAGSFFLERSEDLAILYSAIASRIDAMARSYS